MNYDISQSLVGYQMHCSNLCDLVLRFLEIHLFLLLPDVVSSLLIDEWIFKSLLRIGGCESCPFKTNVKFPNMHGPSGVCGLRMPCQILACIGLSAKHFAVYGLVLGISSLKTTVVAIWQLHFMISTAKSGSAVYLLLPLDYFLNLFFASRAVLLDS